VCLLFERKDKKSAELAVICLRDAGNYEYILLHKTINVFSDNAVVVQLAKHRPMNAREARLIAYLSQFKLHIRHVAGVRNYTADF